MEDKLVAFQDLLNHPESRTQVDTFPRAKHELQMSCCISQALNKNTTPVKFYYGVKTAAGSSNLRSCFWSGSHKVTFSST